MSVVLVSGARTPIGKLLGALAPLDAVQLGAAAVEGALGRSGVAPDEVDSVVLGNVVQAGVGPNPARLAALAAGIPLSAPATTVNKRCLSGMAAAGHAWLTIGAGLSEVVVAGGTASMTNAPHLSQVRKGVRYGGAELVDALEQDALICGIDRVVMGAATQRYQAGLGIERDELDDFSARSHQRAAAAIESGRFDDEIVPVTVHERRRERVVDRDEGIRPETTTNALAALPAAFGADGTLTAGSSSQLSDGAAALVLMDRDAAERRGLTWLAEIVGYASVAGPDPSLLHQPAAAIERVLDRTSLSLADVNLFEMNEAFASVVIASRRRLGIDPELVNVNGGAIALGHPVGMSGARLLLTLALELRRRGGGLGAAALCGGGGQGDAMLLRVPAA